MADPIQTASLLRALERDAMHENDLVRTLEDLRQRLGRLNVPFAVIGALAMRQHGYVRHTEDVDIVTTTAGLNAVHDLLVGLGIRPRAQGLRKKLRNTVHRVDIDVIQSGEHAGSPESPIVYPLPTSEAFYQAEDGVRYATLASVLTFKIASGIWGRRPRDLADVQALIKTRGMDESYAPTLPEPVRQTYRDLVQAGREEIDIE